MTRTAQTKANILAAEEGFTLVELLVVLGIITMLAALVAPQVIRYLSDARSDTANVQLKNIESALELYYLDTATYPTNELGLAALVETPSNVKGWLGPYLKRETGLRWRRPSLPFRHSYTALTSGIAAAVKRKGRRSVVRSCCGICRTDCKHAGLFDSFVGMDSNRRGGQRLT